jgi:hypothetical protein
MNDCDALFAIITALPEDTHTVGVEGQAVSLSLDESRSLLPALRADSGRLERYIAIAIAAATPNP